MTLHEWSELRGHPTTLYDGGLCSVPDIAQEHRAEAWHLEDYRVSSISKGRIWFRPRERRYMKPVHLV